MLLTSYVTLAKFLTSLINFKNVYIITILMAQFHNTF
jgi:hypothetical protein